MFIAFIDALLLSLWTENAANGPASKKSKNEKKKGNKAGNEKENVSLFSFVASAVLVVLACVGDDIVRAVVKFVWSRESNTIQHPKALSLLSPSPALPNLQFSNFNQGALRLPHC